MAYVRETLEETLISVFVQPGSSRNKVEGIIDGTVKIKVTAPPIEGKANDACLKLLAKEIGIPKSSLYIVAGERSKRKTIAVKGYSKDEVSKRLSRLIPRGTRTESETKKKM
jgi:uncharacterized protein